MTPTWTNTNLDREDYELVLEALQTAYSEQGDSFQHLVELFERADSVQLSIPSDAIDDSRERARAQAADFEAAHIEGLHVDVPREGCPICDE